MAHGRGAKVCELGRWDRLIDSPEIEGAQRTDSGNINRCVSGIIEKNEAVGAVAPDRPPDQIVGPLPHGLEPEGAIPLDHRYRSTIERSGVFVLRYAAVEVFRQNGNRSDSHSALRGCWDRAGELACDWLRRTQCVGSLLALWRV